MEITLKELAGMVDGTVSGDPGTRIRGVSGISQAGPGQITFLANPKYAPMLKTTGASAVVVGKGTKADGPAALLTVENPDLAFALIVERFDTFRPKIAAGVHPTAVVAKNAKIGRGVSIGAHCVVEDGATIGDGTVLYPQVYVGQDVKIGAKCLFHPMAAVYHRCVIGSNVILHSGAVVGSDGFGYVKVDGENRKIRQTGIAVLEDDVELGANVTIDRARFGRTVIRRGAKIDNLVMVAHNVEIGENCMLAAQTGFAGSAKAGKNVLTGGQAGIAGHVELGDGAIVTAQSGVGRDVKPGTIVSGEHAVDYQSHMRSLAAFRKLPELVQEVRELRSRLKELEGGSKKK
ncbi:MAG: UDP-3-O-(3-hydroxymyristoyl)glucosamine N-acyltransferase [Planctomycetota bacterium]|jgi:UDP-3-O-[3-hydroxymyristoyl] glucosamine N-acyltransferase